jgi:hypothetical protein
MQIKIFSGFFKQLKQKIFAGIAAKLPPVRFFSVKEWSKMTDKEKIFMTYKHHYSLKMQGDSEIGLIEALVTQFVLVATVLKVFEQSWLIVFAPPLLLMMWFLKWKIGDYKDKRDLIALETEFGTRRNRRFREFKMFMDKQIKLKKGAKK